MYILSNPFPNSSLLFFFFFFAHNIIFSKLSLFAHFHHLETSIMKPLYTGARRLPCEPPPKLEKKRSTLGCLNTLPTTGTSFKLAAAIGKNCPKRYINPYICNIIPNIGHLHNTSVTPPKNATMPRIRSFRLKKRTVRDAPIVNVNPVRNNMSPSANSVESKRNNIPRKRKVNPRNISPVPIFVLSETILSFIIVVVEFYLLFCFCLLC